MNILRHPALDADITRLRADIIIKRRIIHDDTRTTRLSPTSSCNGARLTTIKYWSEMALQTNTLYTVLALCRIFDVDC